MLIKKYVDKLPIPKILKPDCIIDGMPYYEARMQQFKQILHRDIPATVVWGFEGVYPGPTIETNNYQSIKVKWINHLPSKHLLPVDTTVHGAGPGQPRVRTVIHLHGAVVRPESDGYPDAWFTRDYKQVGPHFTTKVYTYPNRQRATTLWYHAHAIGITRLNVYAGLAGIYIIRDPMQKHLNLPKGRYEIPLLIQDRSFNEDGSLYYPSQPDPPVPGVNPSVLPDFFGDTILVNGKVWPYLELEPRKYRFRIINGSNSRFYKMKLSSKSNFYQIGTDGGLFEKPVVTKEIMLAPAERADVIIDFSGLRGQNVLLTNNAPAPFPQGNLPDPGTTGQIMQFRVCLPLSKQDYSTIPYRLSTITYLKEKKAIIQRNLTLSTKPDIYGRSIHLLENKTWDDPITTKPQLGNIEIWNILNLTRASHPIHLHLVNFQILGRQPFDTEYYEETGKVLATGNTVPPDLNERGWKDTVRANPGEITRIIARFAPYTGLYPWHCHILEHEDHEMMRPFEVVF